ncbi:Predicted small secreted protein [Gracilibacillus ureilyticus]|uniref:Predicted small secreted protein n=1 Tax=Gracilibacillus ureilyticus TaxID=531814 RepID=A0A1H9TD66_9BACI|nr:PepSY domain-containing protein [Gracilibacillus ureilyticus]SER95195.1 Predicted small secreted protein [Gracilibacillus ureilyticus]
MKMKQLLSALGIGIVIGYAFRTRQEELWMKPEVALKLTKQKFQKHYDVSGSWIYMKREQLYLNDLSYEVYHGGITKHIDGKHIPLEFFVDAKTGTIIKTRQSEN